MTELKPCPFCGARGRDLIIINRVVNYVLCSKCESEGPAKKFYDEAIAAWNRRHVEAES